MNLNQKTKNCENQVLVECKKMLNRLAFFDRIYNFEAEFKSDYKRLLKMVNSYNGDEKNELPKIIIAFEQFKQKYQSYLDSYIILPDVPKTVEKESIFYDVQMVPKKLIENYYLLVESLLGTKEIGEKTIIFKELQKCLSSLNEREKNCVNLKFGLENGETKTLEEVAGYYNISRERVRQIIEIAGKTLKASKILFYIPARISYLQIKKKEIDDEINSLTNAGTDHAPIQFTIYDFDFSTRTLNCLIKNHIVTYEQLMELTPQKILKMKNAGAKVVDEIWYKLHGEHL